MKIFKDDEQDQDKLKIEVAKNVSADIAEISEEIEKTLCNLNCDTFINVAALSLVLITNLESLFQNGSDTEIGVIKGKELINSLDKQIGAICSMAIEYHLKNK